MPPGTSYVNGQGNSAWGAGAPGTTGRSLPSVSGKVRFDPVDVKGMLFAGVTVPAVLAVGLTALGVAASYLFLDERDRTYGSVGAFLQSVLAVPAWVFGGVMEITHTTSSVYGGSRTETAGLSFLVVPLLIASFAGFGFLVRRFMPRADCPRRVGFALGATATLAAVVFVAGLASGAITEDGMSIRMLGTSSLLVPLFFGGLVSLAVVVGPGDLPEAWRWHYARARLAMTASMRGLVAALIIGTCGVAAALIKDAGALSGNSHDPLGQVFAGALLIGLAVAAPAAAIAMGSPLALSGSGLPQDTDVSAELNALMASAGGIRVVAFFVVAATFVLAAYWLQRHMPGESPGLLAVYAASSSALVWFTVTALSQATLSKNAEQIAVGPNPFVTGLIAGVMAGIATLVVASLQISRQRAADPRLVVS